MSPRDPYGTVVKLRVGGKLIVRELRCGEGYAAQNSRTLLVGIGAAAEATSVEIRWPSGKKQEIGSVPEGTLVTANELEAVATEAYRRKVATIRKVESQDAPQTLDLRWATPSKINLFISITT